MKLLRVVRPGGLQGSRHEKWGWALLGALCDVRKMNRDAGWQRGRKIFTPGWACIKGLFG